MVIINALNPLGMLLMLMLMLGTVATCNFIIWLEKLVWETWVRCLELGAGLVDVDCVEGIGLGFTHCLPF